MRRSVGCRKTWCRYQPDAVAGQRGNTSGVALRMPAHQCQNESSSLPEGESPARTRPSCGVQDLAGGIPGCRLCFPVYLGSVGWRRGRPIESLKTAHLGNLRAGVASAGPPRGIASYSQSNILESLQKPSSGQVLWVNPLPSFAEGPMWQPS